MAPALIEAAATVSQSFGKKLKLINTEILDNIGNFANSRDVGKAIVSSCTLTTNLGRNKIKVTDKSLANKVPIKEELSLINTSSVQAMDHDNNPRSESTTLLSAIHKDNYGKEQSSEQGKGCPTTCALSEADGAKADSGKAMLVDKIPVSEMKEKSIKTMQKLKSLDYRAEALRERVRKLHADRLIKHVQKQAKWFDKTSNYSSDSHWKNDLHKEKTNLGASKSVKISKRPLNGTFDMNSSSQSGQLVNILRGNDSSQHTCPSSQSNSLATNLTAEKGVQLHNPSFNTTVASKEMKKPCSSHDKREDVFGVLATHVRPLCDLNDPDATDPESDDDEMETLQRKFNKSYNQGTKKEVDRVWAKDRVKIGSMCTWIQAQIADLSHKIKRYGDLYHHTKLSRNHVQLDKSRPKATNTANEQNCIVEDRLNRNNINNEDLQDNIFTKLEVHKNGLAKDLSIQPMMYERGTGVRTIPVVKFPKHKYIKQTIKNEIKIGDSSYTCPDLPTLFPCEQCQKASISGAGKTTGNLSAVLLDHSYHGQLSPEYDLQLPYLLESALRKEKLCNGRKSLLLASNPYAEKTIAPVSSLPYASAAISNSVKARLDRKRQRRTSKQTCDDSEHEDHPKPKKKAVSLSAASQLQKRASNLRAPSGAGSGESRPSTPIGEQNFLSSSCPSPSLSQLVRKKNRPSSEYDINNIVIPYSISSSTRLEKPQYKEILTPGWRRLHADSSLDIRLQREMQEDTSDEAYAERHSHCEVVEHKRFTSYFQLPFKRSRSTRKSSECNTPEAYSPSHMDNSNSSFGSVSTPTEFVLATPLSGKLSKQNSLLSVSLQPEDQRVVFWPKRTFPLADDELLQLDHDIDSVQPTSEVNMLPETQNDPACTVSEENAPIIPPLENDQTNCQSPCEEDDEGWTVKLVSDQEPTVKDSGAARKGIVLKLAKK